MATIRDLFNETTKATLLNTEAFGEVVIVTEPDKAPRNIVAIVEDETYSTEFDDLGENTSFVIHEVRLYVSRDRDALDCHDNLIGGIELPIRGTTLERPSRVDQHGTVYTYTGDCEDADEFFWRVTFRRRFRRSQSVDAG